MTSIKLTSERPLNGPDRLWAAAWPMDIPTALGLYNEIRRMLGAKSNVPAFQWSTKKDTATGYATVGAANSKLSKAKDLLID
jgi:hypothetical protein